MRILVTGATGFVGNTLLPELPKAVPDAEITAFVLPDDTFRDYLPKHKKLFIIEGDITDKKEALDAVKGHSHVIHLAGLKYRRGLPGTPHLKINPHLFCGRVRLQ